MMEGIHRAEDLTEEVVQQALTYGNAAGSLCVQKPGGIPALPTREEILGTIGRE